MIFSLTDDNNMTGGTEICEGCCEVIYDRFVFRVGNNPWHEGCLFCSDCSAPLTNSCYYKESRLLCRADYERRFGVKCGRCLQCLLPHELVMRTRYSIYHIACFVCTVCGRNLNRGDQYVVRAGQLVCMADYEKECFMVQGFSSSSTSSNPHSEFVQDGQQGVTDDFVVEGPTGRQRDGRRGPKRPRTILTAAQRRQFKASFEVSPKPCRKVREGLAKETGLSVRVVQVWFQNQRAKMKKMQRRGKLEKDGSNKKGSSGKDSKNGSVDGSNKGGGGGGGSSGGKSGAGKENFEGTESVASHEDQFVDSDDDDELVFDPMDDVATSDEHSETGGSSVANIIHNSNSIPSSHLNSLPPAGVVGPDAAHALDLVRGLPMPPAAAMHPSTMSSSHGNHSSMHHPSSFHLPPHNPTAATLHPVPPSVESLHSANPIDKLYLMQDSYFTQM